MVGKRKRGAVLALMLCAGLTLQAQEVLVPLQWGPAVRPGTKAVADTVRLPFFDDFAKAGALPTGELWDNHGVTIGNGAGLLPPTVGVATLDAVGADGRLYDGATAGVFGADTLCSQALALGGLGPEDSVVLSFYYLPGGGWGDLWLRIGDAPETGDSLMLEFYRAADSAWVPVWSRGGTEVDSLVAATGRAWQYVAVAITDTAFFNDGFAFRFRNLCSVAATSKPGLAGNCDYWHLDYVLVDQGRTSVGVPEFRDVAFVAPAPSLLAHYQAMPARQYRQSEMAAGLEMTIANLYGSPLATQYQYAVVGAGGDTLYRYDGGFENAPAFLPDGSYQTAQAHAAPAVGYAFPEGEQQREYTIVHTVREGVGGDMHGDNDTMRFRQVLADYYAYDDGTAENGYGLTSTASRVYLAYRFDLNAEDTLTALDMCFNRSLNGENEDVPFYITVWRCENGVPREVLYRDHSGRRPVIEGLDGFHRYALEEAVVVGDSIFVGFEQANNYFINLGFDRNGDASDRICYLTGTEWQQSILRGALMMRPCFGAAATVGIEERRAENDGWSLYPNPADEYVQMEGVAADAEVWVYDMNGKKVAGAKGNRIETRGLPGGVYVVRCVDGKKAVVAKKLIIKH
ncbi:MAG: T9SS type A sorting domain-containing protein [Bacteroidales bacterium]|nr:T9SS type A sorting domain-containing protein [Bacteroidales bacterium]